MSERTRKRLVFGLLIAAVIFGLSMRPWESHRRRKSDTPPGQAAPTAQTPNSSGTTETVQEGCGDRAHGYTFATKWPADPFLRPDARAAPSRSVKTVVADARPADWTFQGVIAVDDKRACVIDGQVYTLGSVIDGWKIKDIEPTQVLLVRASNSVRLALP